MGNPMDAFRKAEKAKQLKKNAADRKKKREDKTVKQDTRHLEAEINDLKARDKLSNEAQERLSSLKSELAYVTKLKDKYVAKHPGERDKVFHKEGRDNRASGRWHSGDGNDDGEEGAEGEGSARPRVPRQARPDPTAHLYNADGTLKDPRRSYYYDATYNPFGVPPPGMPYRERTISPPAESDSSDEEDEDDSDDDIVMPEGPRPGEASDSDNDSDDSFDIPLPEGPPPARALPPPPQPHHLPFPGAYRPPPHHLPRAPVPIAMSAENPGGWGHLAPQQPPRPRGPTSNSRGGGPSGTRRPLSKLPPPPSSLPAKPGSLAADISASAAAAGMRLSRGTPPPSAPAPSASTSASAVAVTISAEPQLRDLRKETTVFVPRGVAKRKAPGPSGLAPVNAAPNAGNLDADGDQVRVRAAAGPSLMGKLHGVLGSSESGAGGAGVSGGAGAAGAGTDSTEDEYAKFLEGL